MKENIHPKINDVVVKLPGNHGTFNTTSTYAGGTIYQDVYYETHPAWMFARTGKEISGAQHSTGKKVEKFKGKFGGMSSFLGKAITPASDETAPASDETAPASGETA